MARSTAAEEDAPHTAGAAGAAGALSCQDTGGSAKAACRPASEARGNGFH